MGTILHANQTRNIAVSSAFYTCMIKLENALSGSLSLVTTWRSRARDRAALAHLNEHILADIGLNRYEARREAEKPFWAA